MNYSALHHRIFEAILEAGASTDERLERLPRFRRYAKSTIRSRRAELAQKHLRALGTTRGRRGRHVHLWGPR